MAKLDRWEFAKELNKRGIPGHYGEKEYQEDLIILAHRDLYDRKGKKIKAPIFTGDYNKALTFAEFDIKSNWNLYKKAFNGILKYNKLPNSLYARKRIFNFVGCECKKKALS